MKEQLKKDGLCHKKQILQVISKVSTERLADTTHFKGSCQSGQHRAAFKKLRLHDVSHSAPYMHNGKFNTLDNPLSLRFSERE